MISAQENAKGRGTITVDGRTYDEAHLSFLHVRSMCAACDVHRPTAWKVTLWQGRSRRRALKRPASRSCAKAARMESPASAGAGLCFFCAERNGIMEGCRQHFAKAPRAEPKRAAACCGLPQHLRSIYC